MRSFSTLYTQGVKVHPGILKNSFYSLCGTSLPTLCTYDSVFGWILKIFFAGWYFVISCYLLVDSCSVYCRILFASTLLWSFIYFVPVKWKSKKQQILYFRREIEEWLRIGIFPIEWLKAGGVIICILLSLHI